MTAALADPVPLPTVEHAAKPGEEPVNILLVDDQPKNLAALEVVLAAPGVNLVKAESGPEALRQLLHGDFAAILLDVHMPGMDGLEAAEIIRARPRTQHTPIIFVTAYEDTDRLFRGYELGAIDYLIKPIVPVILRGKVNVLIDLFRTGRKLRRQTEQLREMERLRLEHELTAARQRWETERFRVEARAARQVQENFFPADRMPIPGFDVVGGSFPVEATGGDYFDYVPMNDDTIGVVIADVSGHGYGPALLMAEVRAYLRALTLTHTDIGQIVGLLNRALHADVPEGRFATLFLGRLDWVRRTFSYVNAGHTSGLLLDSAGRLKRRLGSTGVPLAILPDEIFPATEPVELADGDVIVLLTDGIPEAAAEDGSQFGMERVQSLVRANRHEAPGAIINALYCAVRQHLGDSPQADDMTAIVIKVQSVESERFGDAPSADTLPEIPTSMAAGAST
jgi:serine phosphatase RsbU (regulator of sigma subunit)